MAGLDDTDDESGAVAKHIGGMRERMAAAKADPENTDEVSVETPEPDEEDDEAPEATAPTRRDRRAGRQTARERAAALEAENRLLREFQQQRQPERQEQRAPDTADVDKRIRATYSELERLEEEYLRAQQNKTLTPDQERKMRDRAQELEIQKMELAAERREVQRAPQRAQEEFSRSLELANADVYHHPQAIQYAAGHIKMAMARGARDSRELHDEAMELARIHVLGKKPKPDAIDRQRATGMSPGPRSVPTGSQRTISMPKGSPFYRMATAMYPELDPGQACQKWAQGPGKKLLAKQA